MRDDQEGRDEDRLPRGVGGDPELGVLGGQPCRPGVRSKYGRASFARLSTMGKTGSERVAVFVTPSRVAAIVTDPLVSVVAGSATTQTSPTVPGVSWAGRISTTFAFVADASIVTADGVAALSPITTRKQYFEPGIAMRFAVGSLAGTTSRVKTAAGVAVGAGVVVGAGVGGTGVDDGLGLAAAEQPARTRAKNSVNGRIVLIAPWLPADVVGTPDRHPTPPPAPQVPGWGACAPVPIDTRFRSLAVHTVPIAT